MGATTMNKQQQNQWGGADIYLYFLKSSKWCISAPVWSIDKVFFIQYEPGDLES